MPATELRKFAEFERSEPATSGSTERASETN